MLNIKRKLSQKGFSLIELMVAVVILALAIFGIFQAYSTGFMGMADARDRTVATNYAREAMEDIKNKDFDQIITQSRNYINGTKYEREVIVQESTNLKKVTTKVYWHDRNGNTKMVETDMAVHFIETTASYATKIILYANHYNILTENPIDDPEIINEKESMITAVIKDAKGNTVTATDYNISFSITQVSESAGGGISASNKITIDGKATTTFTSSGGEGEVIITASSGSLTPDSVTIKITDLNKPVKIDLAANPMFMTPGSESIITATIVNAGGNTVPISKVITFSVSGPGTLSTPTTLNTVDGNGDPSGIVTIPLTSNGTPGTITVTASSTDLEPGLVDVITGGQISLSASLIDVPVNETSIITVTTKDVNGVPIKYIGYIKLSIGEGSGDLSSELVYFDGSSPTMTVNFTAGNTPDTIVKINAVDQAGILASADPFLTLNIKSALIPHHIGVHAIPLTIPAGGTKTSLITAKVMSEGNVTVTSYNKPVTFETTAGSFSDSTTSFTTTTNFTEGVATVDLYPSDNSETATITVSSTVSEGPPVLTITGDTEVGFYIGPDHIILSADPQKISVNGESCTVTAKIVDYAGTLIGNYNEDIAFSISPWPTTIEFSKATTAFLVQKVKKGITTVTLKSGTDAGMAEIEAFSGNLFGSLNIPVGITLSLVNSETSPSYDSTEKIVSFDIDVQGANLFLEEMQVSWDSPEGDNLNKIEVKTPSNAETADIVFDGSTNPASSGVLINVEDVTLIEGISNVKMYFNADMSGKTILDVTFNPNSGDYTVNLK